MKVRRPAPDAATVKEWALALCLILSAVLLVVGVAKVYVPAGFIAAALCLAGLAWFLLTESPDAEPDEVPR